jgi:hypothetical protein
MTAPDDKVQSVTLDNITEYSPEKEKLSSPEKSPEKKESKL